MSRSNPVQPPDKKANAINRRKFILNQIQVRGEVTFDEIRKNAVPYEFDPPEYQSLKDDNAFFEQYDLDAKLMEERKGVFGPRHRSGAWMYEERKKENLNSKTAIGRMAAALVWGSREEKNPPHVVQDLLQRQQHLLDQIELVQDGAKGRLVDTCSWVRQYLKGYWTKYNRSAAIDAGSTTFFCAELAARPERDAGMHYVARRGSVRLRILTNAPRIEELMWDPTSLVEVVTVGGALRKGTAAHSGELAVRSLGAMAMHTDIALIGTTTLRNTTNAHGWGMACDSESEAIIKGLLLENSDLRCVVLDSSKFGKSQASAFVFAALNSDRVHLLLTDAGFDRLPDKAAFEGAVRNAGVLVLKAEPTA